MAKLRYQVIGADTLGTTHLTREPIGSITCPSNATKIYGFLFQRGSSGVTTTAEATQGRVFVNARSLGYQEMDYTTGQPTGGGSATNESGVYDPGIFYPFRARPGSEVANEEVFFYYDNIIDMTQEDYVQAFLLTSDGGIDEAVLSQRGDPLTSINRWVDWSATAFDATIGSAVSEKLDNSVKIPGYVDLIHSVVVTVASDAVPTTAEHLAGYLTLSGTLPDLQDINIPIPLRAASLGTAAEWSVGMRSVVYPLYIPMSNKNETLDLTANIAATTSGANIISATFLGSADRNAIRR